MRVPVSVRYPLLLFLSAALVIAFTAGGAIAQSQTWAGEGYIVQGSNRGGLVSLKIRIDDRTVYFLQGQSAGQQITLPQNLEESMSTQNGEWTFQSLTEDRIDAIFIQTRATIGEIPTNSKLGGLRTIEYILKPEDL